jgi:hypothetical protein
MSPEDRIVNLLSRWLAGHLSNDELRREVEDVRIDDLDAGRREAMQELLTELERAQPRERRGGLEVLVRETIEALALGV